MNDIPSKIDKYEIIEEIGRGGMAIVYKGLHPFLDKYIAVKVLPEYFVQDKEFVERFTREAKVMFNLKHPNIVRIYDAGIYQGKYFIVMQYIEGKTLKALIREKGSIPIEQSVEIVMQVAEALSYAHKKGVIHRDIKPSNILIEKDTNKAYVTDFGIAKAVSNTKLTQTGVSLGTPEYMSPEQFLKSNEVDQRTDIYSLGIVLYEMLTGDIPFKGETPVGIAFKHVNVPPTKPRIKNPKISPYLEKIILKMLSKNLDERYKTMDALFKDLQYFKDKEYDKISALSYTEERKCKLAVTSIPSDAKVYIDGDYIGKTPLTDVEVNYGKHKLLLVKSGYDDYNDDIFLNKVKSSVSLNITLTRENNEATAEETKTVFPMPSGQQTQRMGKSNKETVSSSEGETIVSKPEERIIEKTQKVSSNTIRENRVEAKKKTVMANKEQKPRQPSLLIPLVVIIIAILVAAFVIGQGRNTVNGNKNVFSDDFSNRLSQWRLFGSPTPVIDYNAGNPAPSFNNNGDPNYDSGAYSIKEFNPAGTVLEGDIYVASHPDGCWMSGSIGFAKSDTGFTDTGWPGYAVGIMYYYIGDACWASPLNHREHGALDCYLVTDDGSNKGKTFFLMDSYLNAWHHYKIVIAPNRYVKFYIDNTLVYAPTYKLGTQFTKEPLVLGNRSYYGDSLVDNVRLTRISSANTSNSVFKKGQ